MEYVCGLVEADMPALRHVVSFRIWHAGSGPTRTLDFSCAQREIRTEFYAAVRSLRIDRFVF